MRARRKSVPVRVGNVVIGGAAEIVVQSMTKADTRDVKATLNEIARLKDANCRIVRVAVPTKEAAMAMVEIKKASPLPIIADIHYDAPLALMALEAGVDGLRLNPGNIKDPEKVKEITRRAKEREVPIRIGVNAGSLPGRPKEGIGDTIRVSLAGDSVDEVEVGYGIVNALAEKLTGPNLIACPMCGRLEIDMLPMVAEVEKALKKIKRPINVSVMGCVVNGPGEGQHADIGIAGGKNKGILFKHGKIVGTFPENELVPALLRELEAIAKEDEQKLAS